MSDLAKGTYEKANSLQALHGRSGSEQDVLDRVRALRSTLDQQSSKAAVLERACRDLLDGGATSSVGRFQLRPHVIEEIRRLSNSQLERYLYYRYRYDVFPATREVDAFPPCLQIEPSAVCNYRCVFCYQTDPNLTAPKNGHMKLMTLDLFKRIIDQAQGRCEAVTLASRGEPLMAKNIEQMLAYAAGKFLAFKVNTNAWFLDEAKSRALLEADLNTLVFSADAADPEMYAHYRVNGSLDRVLRNVAAFAELRAREFPNSRVITRVSGVRVDESQDIDTMVRLWGGLVDQVAFVDYNPWENTYARPLSGVTTACSDLWRRLFVWADGRTNPCDVDYLSTLSPGDIAERTLADIWTGDAYRTLRDRHLAGERAAISPCQRCTLV